MAHTTFCPIPRARIAALLAAVLVLPLAVAKTDGHWASEERTVSAASDGSGLRLLSLRDSPLGDDRLAVSYDPQSAALTYGLEAQRPDPGVLGVSLRLRAVTEYDDVDGDGQLGVGDHIVRRVPIAGTPAVTSVQPLDGNGWRVAATHALPPRPSSLDGGRVIVTVDAWPDESSLAASPAPTTFTLTVALDAVARGGDGNTTHVALETTFESTRDAADLSADLASVQAGGYRLALRWLEPGRGEATEHDGRTAHFVRSAPAGERVAHSASLAASRPAQADAGDLDLPLGSPWVYGLAAAACLSLLAVPMWRRWRPEP